jgi:hypothetical protein
MVAPFDRFGSALTKLSQSAQSAGLISELSKKTGVAEDKVKSVIAELGLNEIHRFESSGLSHGGEQRANPSGAAMAPTEQQRALLRIGKSIIVV